MIARAMPAAIRPYSIAVAPDSSAANSSHLDFSFIRASFPTLPEIASAGDLHDHNPRLSKCNYVKLTTMNAAFADRFGRVAPRNCMEPALPPRNTRSKTPLSPNCAIAPPHHPPNNRRLACLFVQDWSDCSEKTRFNRTV